MSTKLQDIIKAQNALLKEDNCHCSNRNKTSDGLIHAVDNVTGTHKATAWVVGNSDNMTGYCKIPDGGIATCNFPYGCTEEEYDGCAQKLWGKMHGWVTGL